MIARCVLVLASILGLASSLHAQSETAYETAFIRGNELFDRGEWAAARVEYQAAYAIDPRPILLINIASTFRRQGDRESARVHFQLYLDKAGPAAEHGAIARKALAELELELRRPERPPQVQPRVGYPREVIERPLTLPAGMTSVGAGVAVSPRYETITRSGDVSTQYSAFALIGGSFGISSRIEITGELALDLGDAGRSLLFGRTTFGVARGLALVSTTGFAFEDSSLHDLRFGASLRISLSNRLALISSEDQILVSFDGNRDVLVRLPIAVAYQVSRQLYATVATRLAQLELAAPTAQLLVRDYNFAALGITVAPIDAVDCTLQLRVLPDGGDASVFLRMRI